MKLLITTQVIDKNHPILGFFHGWVLEFAKHFKEVHVICLMKGEYDFPPHVFIYSLGKEEGENRLKYLYRYYTYFAHIFFKVRVDFVFFHMAEIYTILATPFFLLRKRYGTKFYWWKAHGYVNKKARLALQFVDRVYTSTESGFSVKSSKRVIVGQAIDTTHFFNAKASRMQEVIFVGRIMPVKQLEVFLKTAKLLSDRTSLSFRIVGPISDEGYYLRLREYIVSLGIQERVVFTGPKTQREIVSMYQTAKYLLNTSQTQSMDKTVLEGILCGCIPITANKAFKELLAPLNLYLPTQSAEAFADTILRLENVDLENMQHVLIAEVRTKYALATFVKRIFDI